MNRESQLKNKEKEKGQAIHWTKLININRKRKLKMAYIQKKI